MEPLGQVEPVSGVTVRGGVEVDLLAAEPAGLGVDPLQEAVGVALAAEALVDHSPPPPEKDWYLDFARDPGAGRPTKKDRRAMDRLRKPE